MAGVSAAKGDRGQGWFRWAAFLIVVVSFFLLCGELVLWAKGFRQTAPTGVLEGLVVWTHEILGFSSAIFALLLVLTWGGRAFLTGRLPRAGIKVLGIAGVILSVSGLAATVTYGESAQMEQVGGWIGLLLAGRMVPILGISLCTTLFCLLMVGSLMLATNWLFLEEFKGIASLKTGRPTEPVAFSRSGRAVGGSDLLVGAGDGSGSYPLFSPAEPGRSEPAAAREKEVTLAEETMLTAVGEEESPRVEAEPVRVEAPEMIVVDEEPSREPSFQELLDTAAAEVAGEPLTGREHRFDDDEEEMDQVLHGQRLLWQDRPEAEEEPVAEREILQPPAEEDTHREEAEMDLPVTPIPTPIAESPTEPAAGESAPLPSSPVAETTAQEPLADQPLPAEPVAEEPRVEIPRPREMEESDPDRPLDPALVDVAAKRIIGTGRASITLLQRGLKVDSTQASRLMDELERLGLVGPYRGSLAREVLMTYDQWEALRVTDRS